MADYQLALQATKDLGTGTIRDITYDGTYIYVALGNYVEKWQYDHENKSYGTRVDITASLGQTVNSLEYDGTVIHAGLSSYGMKAIDPSDMSVIATQALSYGYEIIGLKWNGQYLFACQDDYNVGKEYALSYIDDVYSELDIIGDRCNAITADESNNLYIADGGTSQIRKRPFNGSSFQTATDYSSSGGVSHLVLNTDGNIFAAGSGSYIYLVQASDMTEIAKLDTGSEIHYDVAYDGTYYYTVANSGYLRAWTQNGSSFDEAGAIDINSSSGYHHHPICNYLNIIHHGNSSAAVTAAKMALSASIQASQPSAVAGETVTFTAV